MTTAIAKTIYDNEYTIFQPVAINNTPGSNDLMLKYSKIMCNNGDSINGAKG